VQETERAKVSGCRVKRSLYKVPFPTPEGPEMMIGRVSVGGTGTLLGVLRMIGRDRWDYLPGAIL
jgi:hypothetical protein